MTLPRQIITVEEAMAYMSVANTISDADRGLLTMLHPMVENSIRAYLRHGITQPASNYVEYYPQYERAAQEDYGYLTISDDKFYFESVSDSGHLLYLNNRFVRSIAEIREDVDARFGQGSGDFSASTILTAGTDYYLQLDTTGFSDMGIVHRVGSDWSTSPGTIKVTYMAGLTSDELDTTYSDIKFSVLEELVMKFKIAKSRAGSDGTGVGIIQSEKVANAYSVQYETKSLQGVTSEDISEPVKLRLAKYRRLPL